MAEYQYVESTGTVVADTSTLRDQIVAEYKAVFGDDLITTENTPQGVLITAETIARDAMLRNNAAVANQINPNIAGGVFLDAIMQLTGTERVAATKSVISGVELAGVAGTTIPAGSQAKTGDGDIFETTSSVVIPGSGIAIGEFVAMEYGPVPAPANSLTNIVSEVLGWDTVDNPDGAVLGKSTQSDVAARTIRRKTLAAQGLGLAEAVYSGVALVEGVRSLTLYENYTGASITVEGVVVVEHSIAVCVDGGTDEAVATALLKNKSLGCDWNGDMIVPVVEPVSGQTYEPAFYRPTEMAIKIRVTAANSSSVTDPANSIRSSIINYADGNQDGEDGFVVGASVSPFEISGAVLRDYPRIYISNVEVALLADSYSTTPVPITRWELATITSGDIEVVLI